MLDDFGKIAHLFGRLAENFAAVFGFILRRQRRTRQGLASTLDSIPGIGPRRRKQLLQRFGSLDEIRKAPLDELIALPGFNEKLAHSVKSHLE